jgi:hypothetical protein
MRRRRRCSFGCSGFGGGGSGGGGGRRFVRHGFLADPIPSGPISRGVRYRPVKRSCPTRVTL